MKRPLLKFKKAILALILSISLAFSFISPVSAKSAEASTISHNTFSPDTSIFTTSPLKTFAVNTAVDLSTPTTTESQETISNHTCADESGALGWFVCPGTGVVSSIVDNIYSTINDFLTIDPIESSTSSTIHVIWNYVRNLSNVVFIIFILIIIYSQLTGIGISNYGIKRTLPRIIICIILCNLSFLICQALVDLSNIAGTTLKDIFDNIQQGIIDSGTSLVADVTWADITKLLVSGGAITALGIVTGGGAAATFWTLLPVLAGALFSVIIGLITVAMRQAVITFLVMLAPLAIICNLLPGTEPWFVKWKKTLESMLVFFPLFAILYGASRLAGWAIMSTSTTGLGVIIGLAVQVYPLIASISLMKMSGTILGTVSSTLTRASAKPLSAISRFSAEKAAHYQAKYLGTRPKGLSQATMQRVQDLSARQNARTAEYRAQAALRGQAFSSNIRNADGTLNHEAEESSEMIADSLKYKATILKNQNDLNKGLSMLAGGSVSAAHAKRLENLDIDLVKASDAYKYELARGAKIEYDNAVSYNKRTQSAIDAHLDSLHIDDLKYQMHNLTEGERASALARYEKMKEVMEGNAENIHFIAADAAQIFGAQASAIQKKYQAYFDLTAPTMDVEHRLSEITKLKDSTSHIDEVIAGLRTLNIRGDTDLVKKHLEEALIDAETGESKIKLGTYASQSLANFLMFDVKNSDPFLRRFGKYINLETARVYNTQDVHNRRHNDDLTFDEYITGEYKEYDDDGREVVGHSKRTAKILLEGTSFKDIERTGYANLITSIRKACTDKDGHVDQDRCEKLQDEIYNATLANLIGDSLTYLSGSEQITSFTQFITGIKKGKNGYEEDFLDIDPDEFAQMSPEEQEALLNRKRKYYKDRTDFFINNHVPSQMGRFKSDVFAGARQLYRNFAEARLTDIERTEYEALTDESAKLAYLDEHGAKKSFQNAIKPKTYEYLQKMYNRGYLSDAKAPISAYLDLDKASTTTPPDTPPDDNDDFDDNASGPAPDSPDAPTSPLDSSSEASLESALVDLDILTRTYNTPASRHLTSDFLNEVLASLEANNIDESLITSVRSLSRELSIYTDITPLADRIRDILS